MINVLIVEDSPSVRMLLQELLETDPGIRVVGTADSGEAALDFLKNETCEINVITMDILMPGMDGFTTTRKIMETTPLPIVIVSGAYNPEEAEGSFKAMEAGAVTIIEKPVAPTHPDYPQISRQMIETVKIMAGVRVVTRWPKKNKRHTAVSQPSPPPLDRETLKKPDLLVIGSSTGGPPVLQAILSSLTRDIPVPILIVQHINPGFLTGLGQWLENETGFPIHIPTHGDICSPGHVYLAPDAHHMEITAGMRILLEKSEPENGHRPSVSHLFRSAAHYFPQNTIAVLLTGMGSDGAAELKLLKDNGSVTIVQDEESCVVFGMPGEAVKINGARYVLPPVKIAEKIMKLTTKKISL